MSREASIEALKDMLQLAANKGAFICPLAGQEKPGPDGGVPGHEYFCGACRVRQMLTPGWYVRPETEMVAAWRQSTVPETGHREGR